MRNTRGGKEGRNVTPCDEIERVEVITRLNQSWTTTFPPHRLGALLDPLLPPARRRPLRLARRVCARRSRLQRVRRSPLGPCAACFQRLLWARPCLTTPWAALARCCAAHPRAPTCAHASASGCGVESLAARGVGLLKPKDRRHLLHCWFSLLWKPFVWHWHCFERRMWGVVWARSQLQRRHQSTVVGLSVLQCRPHRGALPALHPAPCAPGAARATPPPALCPPQPPLRQQWLWRL